MRALLGLLIFAASDLLSLKVDAAPGKSLEVAPTTLELKAGEPGLLYVANHSSVPVTVQIDIYDWNQSQNADHLVLSDTAFVSPPLTTIAPGERQIVRVLAQPKLRDDETSYRLRVSELPDANLTSNGVQVLLQFNIPAFVRGAKDGNAIAWTARATGVGLELAARNDGARTVKLAGLRLSSSQGSAANIDAGAVNYILPDAVHVWTISAPGLTQATRVHIEGMDERSGKPIAADAGVAR
jgi:fimbrial chaperone protein